MAFPNNPNILTAAISFSGSGDNPVIAGVVGKSISVVAMLLAVGAATNITFKDGGSNLLSGAFPLVANGSIALDYSQDGKMPWYWTTAGNAFVINSSNAVQVSGTIYYTVN